MVVELVSVGTELLLGNIVNTNTQYLAEQCALLGLSLYHQSVVGDNHDRLAEVVKTALGRSDVVILTGGLGPTEDDLTKEVCAEVMGYKLVEKTTTKMRKSHLKLPTAMTGGSTPKEFPAPMLLSARKERSFRTGYLKKPVPWLPGILRDAPMKR